jgi:hypothetical protein
MLRLPQHIDLLPNGCIIPCTEDTCTNLLLSLNMRIEGGSVYFDYYNADTDDYLSNLIIDTIMPLEFQRNVIVNIITELMKSDFKTPISYIVSPVYPANSEIF